MSLLSRLFAFLVAISISGMTFAEIPSFYWQTYKPKTNEKLYDSSHCGKICPEIQYDLIDTSNPWLDTKINKTVVNTLGENIEDTPAIKAKYAKFNATAVPTSAQYAEQINDSIADLVAQNKAIVDQAGGEWNKKSPPPIQVWAKPKYLGSKILDNNRLELLMIEYYNYSGVAHGVGGESYYVFDMAKNRALTLDDMILPYQKPKLEQAVKAKYIKWIKEVADSEPDEYQKMWQFHMTDNFTFTKEGLRFVYQPYEISPYVLGMPELIVSYGELQGILKPEYLK